MCGLRSQDYYLILNATGWHLETVIEIHPFPLAPETKTLLLFHQSVWHSNPFTQTSKLYTFRFDFRINYKTFFYMNYEAAHNNSRYERKPLLPIHTDGLAVVFVSIVILYAITTTHFSIEHSFTESSHTRFIIWYGKSLENSWEHFAYSMAKILCPVSKWMDAERPSLHTSPEFHLWPWTRPYDIVFLQ